MNGGGDYLDVDSIRPDTVATDEPTVSTDAALYRCCQCHGTIPPPAIATMHEGRIYCETCIVLVTAPPPVVDVRLLHLAGQQLLAAREAVDAALLSVSIALGESQPTALSGCDTEDVECDHPRDRRQVLNVIGDRGKAQKWICRDCGYNHDPT